MDDQMTPDGILHGCVELNVKAQKIRPDLLTEPILQAHTLYTDGCCYREEKGELKAGFAVARQTGNEQEVVVTGRLQGKQNVIEACK